MNCLTTIATTTVETTQSQASKLHGLSAKKLSSFQLDTIKNDHDGSDLSNKESQETSDDSRQSPNYHPKYNASVIMDRDENLRLPSLDKNEARPMHTPLFTKSKHHNLFVVNRCDKPSLPS